MKHTINYKGIYFTKESAGYFRCQSIYRVFGISSLHREIWKSHYGPIPDGCDVHHKDKNTENNDISNLECLTKEDHAKEHSDERRRRIKSWWASRPRHEFICCICNNLFTSKYPTAKCCSKRCRNWATRRGIGMADGLSLRRDALPPKNVEILDTDYLDL